MSAATGALDATGNTFRTAIAGSDFQRAGRIAAALPPADLRDALWGLTPEETVALYKGLRDEPLAALVERLEPEDAGDVLRRLPDAGAADVLDELAPDDAADVIEAIKAEVPERAEPIVGLIKGGVFGLTLGLIAWFWKGSPILGVVAGVSLFLNIAIVASTTGVLLPMALRRLGIDPATIAGVFDTMLSDLMGNLIYLGVGDAAHSMALVKPMATCAFISVPRERFHVAQVVFVRLSIT
jgi:Mg/Co/Ni transporter MgtE